jgi:hypothetical protein
MTPNGNGHHAASEIKISWHAPHGLYDAGKDKKLPVIPRTVAMTFNPLNGAAFDKFLNSITYLEYKQYVGEK